jgi:hypothetical protein
VPYFPFIFLKSDHWPNYQRKSLPMLFYGKILSFRVYSPIEIDGYRVTLNSIPGNYHFSLIDRISRSDRINRCEQNFSEESDFLVVLLVLKEAMTCPERIDFVLLSGQLLVLNKREKYAILFR